MVWWTVLARHGDSSGVVFRIRAYSRDEALVKFSRWDSAAQYVVVRVYEDGERG